MTMERSRTPKDRHEENQPQKRYVTHHQGQEAYQTEQEEDLQIRN